MTLIHTKLNIRRIYNIYTSIFLLLVSLAVLSLFGGSAFAENLDYEVNIQPSLVVTIPTNTVELDINPATAAFSSQDLSVSVGTNNPTGYTLTMSSESTSLMRNGGTETIPTLSPLDGGYTEDSFTENRWGYRLVSTNYLPFTQNIELDSNDGPTNSRTSTVTFGAKANIQQPAGAYQLDINFTAVANALPAHTIADGGNMQDVSSHADGGCPDTLTTGQAYTLTDSRDGEEYKVARLADGNCWLLDNLRFDVVAHKSSILSTNTNIEPSIEGDVLTSLESGNRDSGNQYANAGIDYSSSVYTYSAPRINIDYKNIVATSYGMGSGKIGVYYNYCAASAGTYCYGSGYDWGDPSGDATSDVCPKGWRMPTGNWGYEHTGEYNELATALGLSLDEDQGVYVGTTYQTALSVSLSGFERGLSFYNQNTIGYLWSSTWCSLYTMCAAVANSSYTSLGGIDRHDSYSVRCLLK